MRTAGPKGRPVCQAFLLMPAHARLNLPSPATLPQASQRSLVAFVVILPRETSFFVP